MADPAIAPDSRDVAASRRTASVDAEKTITPVVDEFAIVAATNERVAVLRCRGRVVAGGVAGGALDARTLLVGATTVVSSG